MSRLGGGALVGLLLGLAAIWWLHPLNAGAATLLVTITVAIGTSLAGLFGRQVPKRDE
jgi:hypothetical protein